MICAFLISSFQKIIYHARGDSGTKEENKKRKKDQSSKDDLLRELRKIQPVYFCSWFKDFIDRVIGQSVAEMDTIVWAFSPIALLGHILIRYNPL